MVVRVDSWTVQRWVPDGPGAPGRTIDSRLRWGGSLAVAVLLHAAVAIALLVTAGPFHRPPTDLPEIELSLVEPPPQEAPPQDPPPREAPPPQEAPPAPETAAPMLPKPVPPAADAPAPAESTTPPSPETPPASPPAAAPSASSPSEAPPAAPPAETQHASPPADAPPAPAASPPEAAAAAPPSLPLPDDSPGFAIATVPRPAVDATGPIARTPLPRGAFGPLPDAPPPPKEAPRQGASTRLAPLVITAGKPQPPQLPAYPADARYRRQQGDVLVEVELDPGGAVHSARVKTSSGHASLDAAALRSARALRFRPPRPPPGVVLRHLIVVEIPFSFRLE